MNLTVEAAVVPRRVAARRGWDWLVEGYGLFRRAPGTWVAMGLIYIVITLVASFIPGGSIALSLFGNALVAGFVLGAHSLDSGGTVQIEQLFGAFRSPMLGRLVLLSLLYMAGTILILLTVLMLALFAFGFSHQAFSQHALASDPAQHLRILLLLLIALALLLPLMMGIWLAPSLIVLGGLGPVAAFKRSFHACWINFVPLLVYGIVLIPFFMVAVMLLGLGLLVMVPVMCVSVYMAYRDIFPQALPPAAPPPLP